MYRAIFLTVFVIGLLANSVFSATPKMISYQGILTDSTGSPLNTTVSIRFTIYDALTGGNIKWSENHISILVTEGLFSVILGAGSPPVPIEDSVFNQPTRYLGVTVGGNPEISPRTQMLSVGYSHRVNTVDGATGGTISGDVNIQSELVVNGPFIRTVARASGLGPNDGTDAGLIAGRTLVFTKTQDATAVRVSYTDNFRSIGIGSCRWEIRFNGASCPGGVLVYDYYTGDPGDNDHGSYTVVGHCEGLGQGTYNIQIFVGSTPGFAGVDCYTGYNNSRWVLEAEEVY